MSKRQDKRKLIIYLEGVSRGIVITDDNEDKPSDQLANSISTIMSGYRLCSFRTKTDCLIVRPNQINGVHIQGGQFEESDTGIVQSLETIVDEDTIDGLLSKPGRLTPLNQKVIPNLELEDPTDGVIEKMEKLDEEEVPDIVPLTAEEDLINLEPEPESFGKEESITAELSSSISIDDDTDNLSDIEDVEAEVGAWHSEVDGNKT